MRARVLALALVLAACGTSGTAGDQAALLAVLDADADVAGILHQADGLVVAGRGRDALAILSGQASERAKRNEGVAGGLAPRTRWGKTRAEDVRKLAHERNASVSAYRSALAADDASAVVETLEAQKQIESHAIAATAAVKDAPPAGCGPGDGSLRFFATLPPRDEKLLDPPRHRRRWSRRGGRPRTGL